MKNSAFNKTKKKTVEGCFKKLTIKYTETRINGRPYLFNVSIYWNGKYTYNHFNVAYKKIQDNQINEPTYEDIESYLYQIAIELLYNKKINMAIQFI